MGLVSRFRIYFTGIQYPTDYLQRVFYSTDVSEIGADKFYDSTDNIFRGSLVYDKFKPIQYSNSDQIFTPVWERSGHPTSLLHSVKVQQFQEGSNQIVAFDTIRVEVYFSKQLESITR